MPFMQIWDIRERASFYSIIFMLQPIDTQKIRKRKDFTMNTNGPKAKVYTIKQAATVIEGLTEHRIRQLCRSGELPPEFAS